MTNVPEMNCMNGGMRRWVEGVAKREGRGREKSSASAGTGWRVRREKL